MVELKNRPILIYGSGRSGTTWVQDALAKSNHLATTFEPLHPDAVTVARDFANLYIQPGTQNAALEQFLQSVIDGTHTSIWTAVRVRPDRLMPPPSVLMTRSGASEAVRGYGRVTKRWLENRKYRGQPRIIKFIRANLMIEWIRSEFGLRSALVIRHPCAVLASVCQRSGAEEWSYPAIKRLLLRYLDQESLVEDRLRNKIDALRSLESMAEVHAATWCIENAHLIEAGSRPETNVVCYEHLINDDDSAWQKLSDALALGSVPGPELLRKPSQQASYARRRNGSRSEKTATWQSILADEQISDVQSVLDLFEVDSYRAEIPSPVGSLAAG